MGSKQSLTMDDIARLANVSKPTVSRALANSPLVNRATRSRVLSIAHQQGYAVNRNAQKLRQKRTNTIAVSLDFKSHQRNHISDPFMFDLLAGVSEALGDHNQDLLLCSPDHNDAEYFQNMLWSRNADGVIVLGQGHREDMLNQLSATGAPVVVWGAVSEGNGYCAVGSDNRLGGRLAGQHLLARGRRRILFVGNTSFREIDLRWQGLNDAVEAAEADVSLDQIQLHSFSYDDAYGAARRYLFVGGARPDGVFASSDTLAIGVISAFRGAGMRVPHDVSVVGYNDIATAALFNPRLTTIRQDSYLAGRTLVDRLMRQLEGSAASSVELKTQLILRET